MQPASSGCTRLSPPAPYYIMNDNHHESELKPPTSAPHAIFHSVLIKQGLALPRHPPCLFQYSATHEPIGRDSGSRNNLDGIQPFAEDLEMRGLLSCFGRAEQARWPQRPMHHKPTLMLISLNSCRDACCVGWR